MYEKIGSYFIRDFQISDAKILAGYANNRNVWLNLRDGFPHPYNIQDAENFISAILATDPKTIFVLATEKEPIGCIGLTPGEDVHRFTAELGYWLAEPYWGKGIMTQAVKFIAGYAIETLKFNRVYAEPYAPNHASKRVLEKAGFVYEGTLRGNAYKDGNVLDQHIYSVINSDI